MVWDLWDYTGSAYLPAVQKRENASMTASANIDARVESTHFALSKSVRSEPEFKSVRMSVLEPCLKSRYCFDVSPDGSSMNIKEFLIDEMMQKLKKDEAPIVLLLFYKHGLITEVNARAAYIRRFGESEIKKSEVLKDTHEEDLPLTDLLPEHISNRSGVSSAHGGMPYAQLRLPALDVERVLAGYPPQRIGDGDGEDEIVPQGPGSLRAHLARGQRTVFDRATTQETDPNKAFGI